MHYLVLLFKIRCSDVCASNDMSAVFLAMQIARERVRSSIGKVVSDSLQCKLYKIWNLVVWGTRQQAFRTYLLLLSRSEHANLLRRLVRRTQAAMYCRLSEKEKEEGQEEGQTHQIEDHGPVRTSCMLLQHPLLGCVLASLSVSQHVSNMMRCRLHILLRFLIRCIFESEIYKFI